MISIKVALWKTQKWKINSLSQHSTRKKVENSFDRPCRPYQRQMSSLGRFSLQSETPENPSVMTFFLLLGHNYESDVNLEEFNSLLQRKMLDMYERFNARICPMNETAFEVHTKYASLVSIILFFNFALCFNIQLKFLIQSKQKIMDRTMDHFSSQVIHPRGDCNELHNRIEYMLLSPLNVQEKLWEVTISSGDYGSSGAVTRESVMNSEFKRETLILFRVHHSVCDGVSMSSVLGDLTDESDKLRQLAHTEKEKIMGIEQRMKRKAVWIFQSILYYFIGGMWALVLQLWRMAFSTNPFDDIMCQSPSRPRRRSICWRHLGSIEEIRAVKKSISRGTTLNDLAVSLATAAIRKQLEVHSQTEHIVLPETVNIAIPVHLDRGIVQPGHDIGNKIGAFVTSIPINNTRSNTILRVKSISKQLNEGKQTPAPWIAWIIAKILSDYTPKSFAKIAMVKANAKAVAVISNIRGFPTPVHWLRRSVQTLCAFLPVPPGIPIGIMIMSYAGSVSFSVNADNRAVPDPEKFSEWMIEEFNLLKKETGVKDTCIE